MGYNYYVIIYALLCYGDESSYHIRSEYDWQGSNSSRTSNVSIYLVLFVQSLCTEYNNDENIENEIAYRDTNNTNIT